MAYTWTEFLDDIKVRSMMPTSQSTYTEARLLRIANAVMGSKVLPALNKVREAYYSYDLDYTISTGSNFLLPTRAAGAKLEDAAFISGTERQSAVRYEEQELTDTTAAPSSKPGFYLKRNRIYVLPTDGAGWDTLRLSYIMRPNSIVATTSAAQITAINTGTKTLTLGTVPSTWTTASLLDLIQGNPNFEWHAIDQVITAIVTGAAGTITFSTTLPTDLVVGDWVSLQKESTVIQVPVEAWGYFAQECANVILRSQTDQTAYKLGLEEAKMLKEDLMNFINPRVEKAGKKLSNRTGILRRSG